jgi:hypothetical protein
MLKLGIVDEQDVKNLAGSFKGEQFFEELLKIVSQKVIASEQEEISKVLSQEDIDTANNFIRHYGINYLYLGLNENPKNVAKAIYGIMILSDLYDNYGSKKDQLTERHLKNTVISYFSNLITEETMNSFFGGADDLQESIKSATDYLLSNINYFGIFKVDLLQNRISLNQKQILSTSDKTKLSERMFILERYEEMLKKRYQEVTKKTANTLDDILKYSVSLSWSGEFELYMSAIDIMIARNDIAKVTDTKDDYSSLNVKLQRDEELLLYLTNLSKKSDELFLSQKQLDEVNQKIRVLSNDSIALRAQMVVASSDGKNEAEKRFPPGTKGLIQDFIKALSIKESLNIDVTDTVYIAIENFNREASFANLQSIRDLCRNLVSQDSQNRFNEVTSQMLGGDKLECIEMLKFVSDDITKNARGDVSKLKTAVLISTFFNNYNLNINLYTEQIYSLIYSLNALINAMDETEPTRIELEKKFQELFIMNFSISSIHIAMLSTVLVDPETYLSILEKEKEILQTLAGRAVVSDDEILRIVRRKEMLMKNFMSPVANFDFKAIQDQTYKFDIYQALISSYNELISNMSSPELLQSLSLRDLSEVTDGQSKINKIINKLNAFQEISSEEVVYLESIKDGSLYLGKELVNAIKLNLQVDAQMPIDFVSKVLNKADLDNLFKEFKDTKESLIDNSHQGFDNLTGKEAFEFKYAVARADKILANICPVTELNSEFGNNDKYFYVTKYSRDKYKLMQIVQDDKEAIQHRLYAYGYLKAMGVNDLDGYVQADVFLKKVKTLLESKSLQVGNNYFDLRACEIGINIVVSNEVLNKLSIIDSTKIKKFKSFTLLTYRTIMESNFVGRVGEDENADAGLTFTFGDETEEKTKEYDLKLYDRMYRRIAHELGHRQLYALGIFTTENAKSSSMFHEFFADIVAGTFMSKILGKTVNQIIANYSNIKQSYVVFSTDRKTEKEADEEHRAARGLINSIKKAFDLAGKVMNYETILEVSIKIAGQVKSEGLFAEKQEENLAKKIITTVALATADVTSIEKDKGEFLYQFIQLEGASFNDFKEEQKIFGNDGKGQEALAQYIKAKHAKPLGLLTRWGFLYRAEKRFLEKYQNITPNAAPVSNVPVQALQPVLQPVFENEAKSTTKHSVLWYIGISIITFGLYWLFSSQETKPEMEESQVKEALKGVREIVALPPIIPAMQESVASAKFTSITAGVLAFFNTGGFVALVVLLSLSIITGLGAVIAAAIGASVLAIIGTISIMSSIYESNQKRIIKELESGAVLSEQESRLVFAKLVRSLPKETAINLVQATFNDAILANDYLNIVSGTNWQNDIETNEAIINALNGAVINNNSVVMETTDTGRILFSPYIVRALLNNPTMLRVVVEHELHHLEYAKSTSGLRGFIHRIFPGLEEFIVSFRNVFRWVRTKLQDSWREFRGVSVVWNLPEGLALGDILVKKVNEQGFIDAPNIQTGHVQLADGRRGTLKL